jgi:hypothetical protein
MAGHVATIGHVNVDSSGLATPPCIIQIGLLVFQSTRIAACDLQDTGGRLLAATRSTIQYVKVRRKTERVSFCSLGVMLKKTAISDIERVGY